jgi:acetyltransferase
LKKLPKKQGHMVRQLDSIFKPKVIACIGATDKEDSVGYAVIHNLLTGGFEGQVYPVNPKYKTVHGIPAYKSVKKIPKRADLAVIVTPSRTVPDIVQECGEAGVGGLLIISAGFKEAGEEGMAMLDRITEICRKYGMRIIGPNCLGFINPTMGINASFATKMANKGNIAFISQSGALCTSILDWSTTQNVGFSHFVSIGSMVDVGFAELIDYFGMDNATSSILIYMETLKDARKFMSAARAFARSKPIIILKAGKSAEGGQAAMSHTGSIAGNDAAFDAAFQRAGIIRVDTIAQLFNCAQALAMQPRPQGNRLAIVTNAGGPGVLATDYLSTYGGKLAQLSDSTLEQLNAFLPASWSHGNPVDVLGDASAETYRKAMEICQADEHVDGILVILTTQAVTSPTEAALQVVEAAKNTRKPVLAVWMGEADVAEGREVLEAGKIPNYRYPESATDVFLKMWQYSRNLDLLYETPAEAPSQFTPRKDAAWRIIRRALSENRNALSEIEAKELLSCYAIPVGQRKLAGSPEEAADFAQAIGFPVAMKIVSPDALHKTEVGGVKLNISTREQAQQTYQDIISSLRQHVPDAHIEGVLIEQMVRKNFELLIGAKKDPIFGPVIAFGQGGTAVEIYKDMQLGLPPLNMRLARRIIEGTKIYPLLQGYRNMPGVNLEELSFVLTKFAHLVTDFPEISEIDINPYAADDQSGIVLDARILLNEFVPRRKGHPHDHLVISPYPGKYTKHISLRNGMEATLRPIRPEDEPMETQMINNLSTETLYFRFFGYVPRVSHDFLTRFTHIDYDREMAIVAEIEEQGQKKMIGVVRIIADAWGESAEYAIVVADAWQNLELGGNMTDYILEVARDKGIKKVYASMLATNKRMIHMFEKRGFKISREDFETCRAELNLEDAMPFAADLPFSPI